MKVFTGLDWIDEDIHNPEKIVDFILKSEITNEACDLVDVVYVLFRCSQQTNYRKLDIINFINKVEDVIFKNFIKEEGGFSYSYQKSQKYYYGLIVTKQQKYADLHGTLLLLWAYTLILELKNENNLGWKIIKPEKFTKLSSDLFYKYHASELNKYKNINSKTLHIVSKNIIYQDLGVNEDVLVLRCEDHFENSFVSIENNSYDLIIVTDIFDISNDVMSLILKLEKICNENGKIVFSNLNSLWYPILKVFELLRLKKQSSKRNKTSPKKLLNVAKGANLELVNIYSRLYFPFKFLGLGILINQLLEILFFKFKLGIKIYSVFRKSNLKFLEKSKTLIIPKK